MTTVLMETDSLTTTGSSGSSLTTMGTRNSSPHPLTVQTQAKIDVEDHVDDDKAARPSLATVLVKWAATFIIFALLLSLLTQSKISLLALADNLHSSKSDDEKRRMFSAILVLILIPPAVNLARGVWEAGFRRDLPWPKKRAFVVGFIISALESAGICLFVYQVPAIGMGIHYLPLFMNWVLLLPIIFNIVRCCSNTTGRVAASRLALFLFALIFLLAAVIFSIVAMTQESKSIKMSEIWSLPVAVACLSVSWLPRVQSYLLKVETGENVDAEYSDQETSTYERMDGTSHGISEEYRLTPNGSTNEESIQISKDHPTRGNPNRGPAIISHVTQTSRPTWKLTIYMSAVKMVLTFCFSLLIYGFLLFDNRSASEAFSNFKSAWQLQNLNHKEQYYMVANSVSSLVGYLVGYMACTTCLHRGGFALPLFFATPLSFTLLFEQSSCENLLIQGPCDDSAEVTWLVVSIVCLALAQVLSTSWLVWRGQAIVLQKEHQIFWMPTYNSALLEQWMLLARRNPHNDEQHEDPAEKAKKSKIIICTTMYRESKNEMKQLLQSIQRINKAQGKGRRHFESHIFFDGAVKDRNPTEFVLQLVSLVGPTFGIRAEDCCKTQTPYGMTLSWKLPGDRGMVFTIHLKDNFKVKNKKRWSQVMYMSYVLDFLMPQMAATEEDTYILTTDADVRFTPDNVEALLDLMTRDQSVGAVCARTHPLGSGPLVWYQVFEYAIGHWFQKAAEHVVGSVLCSPGCFSVYRCKSLRDILPKYATNVEHAFDFLTKDMGEDRWLCTLMVQSGWRIEYCAASENRTFCPEEFEEFYKQRRRWVASTIANIMLLIKEWSLVSKFNHRVSVIFLVYQAALLFATLIGPSSVMLVVSGGLVYGWNIDATTTIVLQFLICVGYALVCIRFSSKIQMGMAKLLTFVYAVCMIAVLVGTAVQITKDFTKEPEMVVDNETVTTTANPAQISTDIPVSTTTAYIILLAGLFVVTGLLHMGEFLLLAHGVWYLLCLPSGYLILMIYSICNITDRSWGTREEVTKSVVAKSTPWHELYIKYIKAVFFCCFKKEEEANSVADVPSPVPEQHKKRTASSGSLADLDTQQTSVYGQSVSPRTVGPSMMETRQQSREGFLETLRLESIHELDTDGTEDNVKLQDDFDMDVPQDVREWLPRELHSYLDNFRKHGYDNTMLISGMTEKELKDIGVKRRGIRTFLVEDIKLLPDFEIQADVPDNVEIWLDTIGLPEYKAAFKREQIFSSKEMEVLKAFGRDELEKELKITKRGHIKRILKAIEKLRNPTPDERDILDTKHSLEVAAVHDLKKVNIQEFEFWEKLQKFCLFPASKAFSSEEALKVKLGDLRNYWLVIMAVSNILWLILITTLANQGQLLAVAGSNPVGLAVMVIFSFVLIIQFFAMILHRIGTLVHFLGRAPYRYGEAYNTSWAFSDRNMRSSGIRYRNASDMDDDEEAWRTVKESKRQAQNRLFNRKQQRKFPRARPTAGEKQPLIVSQASVL